MDETMQVLGSVGSPYSRNMFHYRWRHAADADQAGTLIPLWSAVQLPPDALAQFKQAFAERQIGRLELVGCNALTGPLIEAGYLRLLELLDGAQWKQPSFPYQGKCLAWIRAEHAALDADARAAVDAILAGTGCAALVG